MCCQCSFVTLCLCSLFLLCIRNKKFKAQFSIKFWCRGIDLSLGKQTLPNGWVKNWLPRNKPGRALLFTLS